MYPIPYNFGFLICISLHIAIKLDLYMNHLTCKHKACFSFLAVAATVVSKETCDYSGNVLAQCIRPTGIHVHLRNCHVRVCFQLVSRNVYSIAIEMPLKI